MSRVPTPWGLPLSGHLLSVGRDVLGFLERSRAAHGDVVRLRIAWVPIYVVGGPELAKQVLLDRRDNYEKTSRSSQEIRHIAGASLLTANGDDWETKRHVLQPAFKATAIERYHRVMQQATDTMLARWRRDHPQGGTIDLAQEMMRLTYHIVSESMLSDDLEGTADGVHESLRVMLDHVVWRLRSVAVPMTWPTPGNRRFQHHRARLHALVDAVIARRRADGRERHDLLDAMMRAAEGGAASLDSAWLRDEVATLLLSGHETTANALAWTWHLLSQHQDIQVRAAEAARAGADPVNAPYLRQLLFEVMRLYPPIWLVERQARDADTLGGHEIPAGANVAVAIWLLHRHPDHWVSPNTFDPERFRDSQHHGRPGPHYLPFGIGPRVCLGAAFAMHEALTVLARCLAHVHVDPVAQTRPVVPHAGVTLRPRDGLPLRVRWRMDAPTGQAL